MQALHEDWSVRAVTAATLGSVVRRADLPPSFEVLTAAKQSDWLRLYLVSRYGGVWLDASIVVLKPLDAMLGDGFAGYHMDGWAAPGQPKVVESWCFAAPPGSRFVNAWFAEFDGAVRTFDDPPAYARAVAETLDLSRFPPEQRSHLAVYLSAQRVLRDGAYDLRLRRSQDGPFFLASRLAEWRSGLLAELLASAPAPPHVELVKLTGAMRKAVEARLAASPAKAGSVLGDLLGAAAAREPRPRNVKLRNVKQIQALVASDAADTVGSLWVAAPIDALPEDLSLLANLESLWAGRSRLRGLPASIAALTRLRLLALNFNRLARVPSLAALALLQDVRLDNNVIEAAPALGPAVVRLALQHNRLPSLPTLPPRVDTVTAEYNRISRADVGDAPRLRVLRLQVNRIAALALGRCPALRELLVDHNELVELPNDAHIPSLTALDASDNRLAEFPRNFAANRFAELRLFGNPWAAPPAARGRVVWADAAALGAVDFEATRVVSRRSDCPHSNVLLARGAAHVVVAFAVGGGAARDSLGQWAGVLHRAGVGADVLSVLDAEFSSFEARKPAFDAFLAKLRGDYETVSLVGSSRGAFGALRFARRADRVLAFSPMKHGRQRQDGVFDAFDARPAGAVSIYVGGRNVDDCYVAERVAAKLGAAARVVAVDSDAHGADKLFERRELDRVVGEELGRVRPRAREADPRPR